MKTMIDLFYETFNPRQKRHHLSMTLKEKPGEHTIRILQNGREIIRATGDEREQAFQTATRDLHLKCQQHQLVQIILRPHQQHL